jgi:hypothetical protein
MDKSIEDSHIARTIAKQIEEEKGEFEHYATVRADDKSGADIWDYKWHTYYIGARYDDVYIAERSSDVEGVHVHDVRDVAEELQGIAFQASHHWGNVDVETSDILEDLAGNELEVPDLFFNPEAA